MHFKSGVLNIITGPNGSGKSTFLKIVSSALEPTSGQIAWKGSFQHKPNAVQSLISFVAPYTELPEELTLSELIEFQHGICPTGFDSGIYNYLTAALGLGEKLSMPIRLFSTGMRQKAKIILALGLNRPVLILDEPTSNLDKDSADFLWTWFEGEKAKRLILIATNDPEEMKKGEVKLMF